MDEQIEHWVRHQIIYVFVVVNDKKNCSINVAAAAQG